MYKQTNTICKPKRIPLFALIINCTILMKTNSRFSRNVYTVSDRIWCNKRLRHTTTEKNENNWKGGYFRFDYDNNMSYRYILPITYTWMGQLNIYNPIYCNKNKRQSIGLAACYTHLHKILYRHLYVFSACDGSCVMMITEDSKMSKIEYDLMYFAYDTPHKHRPYICWEVK